MPQFSKPVIRQIDGLGEVIFRKHRRARRIKIRVEHDSKVVVTLPWRIDYRTAEGFLQSSKIWVTQKLQDQESRRQFHTKVLSGKPLLSRQEAGKLLKSRLAELAERHGFTYNRVSIRDQKSRWGSCSSKNNINLNYKLAWLDDHLRDYVLLHELVHTIHKNHSKRFWAALEKIVPNCEECRREIRQFSPSMMTAESEAPEGQASLW